MNRKGYLIAIAICGITLLSAVGVGVYSLISGSDNPPSVETNETDTGAETDSGTGTIEEGETVSEPDDTETETIPAIKEDPKLPDVQGKPIIDVEEMTRNPEAEVVDSKQTCSSKGYSPSISPPTAACISSSSVPRSVSRARLPGSTSTTRMLFFFSWVTHITSRLFLFLYGSFP